VSRSVLDQKSGRRGPYRQASLRRPGTAPALGLRAGGDVPPIVAQTASENRQVDGDEGPSSPLDELRSWMGGVSVAGAALTGL